MDNVTKAVLLKQWAANMDKRGASFQNVIAVSMYSDMAFAGKLLEPQSSPVDWPQELEMRQRILSTVEAMSDAMNDDGKKLLADWIIEIQAAVDDAQLRVLELGPLES